MKPYSTYQHLPNTEMTERDTQEVGSPFWNDGKFNNFVEPFLEPGEGNSFVDMGCNAGLHLKMAEDLGFRAIGIDSDETAVKRGIRWRDEYKYKYIMKLKKLTDCIDDLPVVDYTVFINAHYYMTVNDFMDYLRKLEMKTRYCIIVTDKKNHLNRCWASADVDIIRSYFRTWEEVGFIDEKPLEGENARRLKSLCFKSNFVEKSTIDKLDSSNHVQDNFCAELDKGRHYTETKYYRILKRYRKRWSEKHLNEWTEERIKNYESIKNNGLRVPIIIDKNNEILDGNHRYAAMRHLGHKEIFTIKV